MGKALTNIGCILMCVGMVAAFCGAEWLSAGGLVIGFFAAVLGRMAT